jgi:amino acid transporter
MQSSNFSFPGLRLTEKLQCQDPNSREFARGLTLFDSTMLVVGAMIGSGIFIVPAEMARQIGSAGWLLVAWCVAGTLTIAGALCYGELSAMMPKAGGMYVYLREAYSPLCGFLYGWTLFSVIETGTIAAVAVAFARFSGVLWPLISEDNYLIAPVHISTHYAVSLSSARDRRDRVAYIREYFGTPLRQIGSEWVYCCQDRGPGWSDYFGDPPRS